MSTLEELGEKFHALSHSIRLSSILLFATGQKNMYLNEIANKLKINRALTKIHLKKLEHVGIMNSWVFLLEDEARDLRHYKLLDFDIHFTPEILKKEVTVNGK